MYKDTVNPSSVDTQLEDSELNLAIRRLQAGVGKEDDYELLVKRFYRRVLLLVHRRLGASAEDAEDLTQEIFASLFKNICLYRWEASFQTWLLRITENYWKNALRAKSTHKRETPHPLIDIDALEAEEVIWDPSVDPLKEVLEEEKIRRLQNALKDLPKKMRLSFLLHLRGQSYPEIALEMGVSVGTVKTQLFRAKRILQQKLAEE